MAIPLPKTLTDVIKQGENPNIGLRFYKHADVYYIKEDKWSKKPYVENKQTVDPVFNFMKELRGMSSSKSHSDAFSIRKRLLGGIGIKIEMTTVTRLVFGMGYDSAIENGLTFDWTTGLPIIPGSSLKGAALNAATREPSLLKADDGTTYTSADIFGSSNDEGDIIFFPAYPESEKEFLDIDIMTPHYKAPDQLEDWHSPVPIKFICVPEGIKYVFRIALRSDYSNKTDARLKVAEKIVRNTLEKFGVGAKTSVDYGYFI